MNERNGIILVILCLTYTFQLFGITDSIPVPKNEEKGIFKNTVSKLPAEKKHELLQYLHQMNNNLDEAIISSFENLSDKDKAYVINYLNLLEQGKEEKALRTTAEWSSSEVDFGNVEEGQKVSHQFLVTNTGEVPLMFKDARSSCGCTVPEFPSYPIPPNQSTKITVEFDSKNKHGLVKQSVIIYDNSRPNLRKILKIRANVIPAKKEE